MQFLKYCLLPFKNKLTLSSEWPKSLPKLKLDSTRQLRKGFLVGPDWPDKRKEATTGTYANTLIPVRLTLARKTLGLKPDILFD